MIVCPQCLSERLERTGRETYLEIILSCAGLYPYRCERCGARLLRMNYTQLFSVIGSGLIPWPRTLFTTAGFFAVPWNVIVPFSSLYVTRSASP